MFVDANVFIYAVGRAHPNKSDAMEFFLNARRNRTRLFTSAEVLQELLHAYHPVGRSRTLSDAMRLVASTVAEVWPLEKEDVELASQLRERFTGLSARDLCHMASCLRRDVSDVMTFDKSLRDAFGSIT